MSKNYKDMITIISEEFISFANKSALDKVSKADTDVFISRMESYPENLVVEAILRLIEITEDKQSFVNIVVVISNYFQFTTLPSKLIKYLQREEHADRVVLRFLFFYQALYFSGYKLPMSLYDLFQDLGFDMDEMESLFEKSEYYIDFTDFKGGSNAKGLPNLSFSEVEKVIDEITPLTSTDPRFSIKDTVFFNLPKGVKINIMSLISHLKEIYASGKLKNQFLEGYIQNYANLHSTLQNSVPLYIEAQDLHREGKNKKALLHINKFIKKVPKFAPGFITKGEILMGLKQYYGAINCFLKSIELHPYHIHPYIFLASLLQMGGYFHSSAILTSYLLKFTPFDFNLYVQLAFNLYQLRKKYKIYLKIAGLLEPQRLINFLKNFWVREQIESKDSLDRLSIEKEFFKENVQQIYLFTTHLFTTLLKLEHLIKKSTPKIQFYNANQDPLYFFPNKEEHTKKNHFIYELTSDFALSLINEFGTPSSIFNYYFQNDLFLKFCMKISTAVTNKLINSNLEINSLKTIETLNSTITNDWIDDALEGLKEDIYFKLIVLIDWVNKFFNILRINFYELIQDCSPCSEQCLAHPNALYSPFGESCGDWDAFNEQFDKNQGLIESENELTDTHNQLLGLFEMTLRQKKLSEKTIEDKLQDILDFTNYLFIDLAIDIHEIESKLNAQKLRAFLTSHAIENRIVQTNTAMNRMKRSINSFLDFLANAAELIPSEKKDSLKKAIRDVEYI
ncbi:MAG: hypothetical protein BAJALOKI1v1_70001 [Promethearchaeota archaeon]|nr:MAG: hypothetical protein BAJALOKI1v1_70001 [Candidatus Lokiarchaeota archaeon]